MDFDVAAARVYGRVRSALEAKGTSLGPYDLMIAAHTLSLGLILVTDNEDEFQRVAGLKIENWRDVRAWGRRPSPRREAA